MRQLPVLLSAFCILVGNTNAQDFKSERETAAESRAICGVNCLYTFIGLQGCQAKFEDVRNQLKSSEIGSNLLQLKKASCRFGVACQIKKCATIDLSDHQLPAIVFGRLGATVTSENDDDQMGHFVLILKLDREARHVTYMDGTSGKIESDVPLEWFDEKMNIGIGIVPQRGSSSVYEQIAALSSLIAFGAGLCFYRPQQNPEGPK